MSLTNEQLLELVKRLPDYTSGNLLYIISVDLTADKVRGDKVVRVNLLSLLNTINDDYFNEVVIPYLEANYEPLGGGGGGSQIILNENVGGTKNGSNTAFTVANNYKPGTLQIIRNANFDFEITETGTNTFTITNPPESDELIKANYEKL